MGLPSAYFERLTVIDISQTLMVRQVGAVAALSESGFRKTLLLTTDNFPPFEGAYWICGIDRLSPYIYDA